MVKEALTPAKKEISKPVEQRSSVETKPVKEERQKPIDAVDPSLFKIVSPMVGTFYRAPGEDTGPFVKIGDEVREINGSMHT